MEGFGTSGESDSSKETRVIEPIRNWLKKNLERRPVQPTPDGNVNPAHS
jgi:hypothetical protein